MLYKLSCAAFALVMFLLPHRGISQSDIHVLATVLGIDGTEGNVSIAAQLAIPVAQGGDGKASTVAKATGGSLSEALENLEIGLGRRVDYGHLSTVALGKDTLLHDVKEFVSYLMSSGKVGQGAYLVYSSHLPATQFIEQAQSMGESSDAELGNFISYNKRGNHITTTTVLKFMQTLHSASGAAYLPCVQLEEDTADGEGGGSGEAQQPNDASMQGSGSQDKQNEAADGGTKQSGEKSGGQGQKEDDGTSRGAGKSSGGEKKKLVAADSMAAYGGDGDKPVLLDSLVARGVVWQDTNSDFGLVELRNAQVGGETVSSVSANLVGKSVRKSAKIQNGVRRFTYKIRLKLQLDDSHICANPRFYSELKNALEKEFENVVKSNLTAAVDASKQSGIDFLGIREWYRKFCREGMEDFDLQNVEVIILPSVKIKT